MVEQQEWKEFNIMPGMTTWIDMPKSYKNAYKRHQEKINIKKKKKKTKIEKIQQIVQKKLTPAQLEQAMKVMESSDIKVDSHLSNMLDDKFFTQMNEGITHKKELRIFFLFVM